MNGLMYIVFISFQILWFLVESSTSNNDLNEISRLEKIFHGIIPDQLPQKCCPPEKIYSVQEGLCVGLNGNENQILRAEISKLLHFFSKKRTIKCALTIILNERIGQNYTLLKNGMLYEYKRNKTQNHDNFCFEYVREYARFMPTVCVGNSNHKTSNWSNTVNSNANGQKSIKSVNSINLNSKTEYSQREYMWKLNNYEENGLELSNNLYTDGDGVLRSTQFRELHLYILVLSSLLLIITLFVYLIVPELHTHEFDWSLMCHIATLVIGFFCIIVASMSNCYTICIPLTYMRQYWMLSSFCWLNVMCVQIWFSLNVEKFVLFFSVFCPYAVGYPLFVLLFTILHNKSTIINKCTKPGSEQISCWFRFYKDLPWFSRPEFIFFYNTVFVILAANMVIFFITAFKVLFENKGWKLNELEKNQHQYDRLPMRIVLCLKLFFIMGLSWMAEIVAFIVEEEELKWRLKNLPILWHAFAIFIIFVCNKHVYILLLKRFSLVQRFKSLHAEKKVLFIPDNTNPRLVTV